MRFIMIFYAIETTVVCLRIKVKGHVSMSTNICERKSFSTSKLRFVHQVVFLFPANRFDIVIHYVELLRLKGDGTKILINA